MKENKLAFVPIAKLWRDDIAYVLMTRLGLSEDEAAARAVTVTDEQLEDVAARLGSWYQDEMYPDLDEALRMDVPHLFIGEVEAEHDDPGDYQEV